MVLIRRPILFALMFCVLLTGCITAAKAVRLDSPQPARVAVVMEFPDRPEIGVAPDSTVERINREIQKRNLVPTVVDSNEFSKVFETRRTTSQRLSFLRPEGMSDYVLLVETQVRFYSLLSGKYRWDIAGTVTLVAPDGEELSAPLNLAAFLDFDHQKEAEALRYAEVAIAERAGQVVDRLLAGRETP